MGTPFTAGDRVRLIFCNKIATGTIQGTRYHQARPKCRMTFVADIVLDDGQKCFEAVYKLTRIDEEETTRLNRAAPTMLRALMAVCTRLGQCPPGHEDHDLAMFVRKAIIMTREE